MFKASFRPVRLICFSLCISYLLIESAPLYRLFCTEDADSQYLGDLFGNKNQEKPLQDGHSDRDDQHCETYVGLTTRKNKIERTAQKKDIFYLLEGK